MRVILAAFALTLTFVETALAADKVPGTLKNTDVFELEYAADPQISPDGKSIAYVRRSMDIMTDKMRSNLWVVSSNGGDHRPLLSGTENYSNPRWSKTGDRLAYVSAVEGGKPQLFVRWKDTGQTALLTNLQEAPQAISWSPDGDQIAFSMFVAKSSDPLAKAPTKPENAKWAPPVKVIDDLIYRADGQGYLRSGRTHIFVVPADGGTPRQLTDGDFNHNGPLSWTVDGKSVLFSANRDQDWEYDPQESDIWAVNVGDGALKRLTNRKGPDQSPLVSPDGAKIAYLGYDDKKMGHHNTRLYVMNLDGSGKRSVAAKLDQSVNAISWAGGSKALYVQYNDHGVTILGRVTLDGKLTPIVRDIGGTSLGRPYTSGSFSTANNGAFAYTSDRRDRPADIAFSTASGRPVRLTQLNEDLLAHKTLGEIEGLTWKSSADEQDIEGWVIKPPNFDPSKKYPLILEIHGGPYAAYGPHFSAELQLYAAAGYVVLYTNPRGSTSYGDDFANLIQHNYPGEDYDDLMSGVDALIAKGYIDSDNLFVTGGSGGGVLSAWIVGKTNRFRAAAVVKPVINWASFALTADITPFVLRYWFKNAPWEDADEYWRRSPLSLVGNVTTPTMLMTGEADYRTPSWEAEQFYQALKLRKIDTVMVRVPEAPHSIARRPSNLIAKVDNILEWFERYRTDPEQ